MNMAELPSGQQTLTKQQAVDLALRFHTSGDLTKAESIYRQILQADPNQPDALHLLGVLARHAGKSDVAVNLINKSIAIRPDYADAYSNRGNAQQDLGRLDEAVASYDKAIGLKPNYAEAYSNRGNVLKELKQLDAAIASYDKAIRIKPDYADAFLNRGIVLQALKQRDAAVASYDKAIRIKPDYAEAYLNRGIVQHELKQLDAAVASYDKAILIKPDYVEAHCNRGNVLHEFRQLDAAVASYDEAIRIKPDCADAYFNRGHVLQVLKHLDEALASYKTALDLEPHFEFGFGRYLHCKLQLSDWADLSGILSRFELDIVDNKKITTPFPGLAVIDKPAINQLVSTIYAGAKYPSGTTLGAITKPAPGGKIRIGYYSADFHNHATAYLMVQLLESHDPSKFELYGFSFGPDTNDEMRKRLPAAFNRFCDVSTKSNSEIAQLSRRLGIEIAVDLKGYTQNSRTGIFAEGCAPLQVNYLGYPGTMGADYMDYMIADRTVIPENSQKYFTEKIAYLPFSYQVNDSKRKISNRVFTKQELCLPTSGFVFCCFNNSYKILPATFSGWMRILKAVEGSVLWLLEDNPTAVKNLRKEAEARGVDANRLVFAKRIKCDEHLARHRMADLFIDTFPCNAHTTASDALWAGLPVLTCMGNSFASRVAGSLLNAMEMPELITHSQEAYEAKAIDFATNSAKLKEIHEKLKRNRLTTPLYDTATFTNHIEEAYQKMYERYREGLPPGQIYVSP